MFTIRLHVAAGLAAILVVALAQPAVAQEPRARDHGSIFVDLAFGYATASGDLGDVSDEGFVAGAGISYPVSRRLSLRSEFALASLRRGGRPQTLGGVRGAQTDIWHMLVGGELELTDEAATPWNVWATLTGGASYFDVSGSPDGGAAVPTQTDWKPTLAGGLSLGYELAGGVGLVGRAALYSMFGDREREGEFLGNERTLELSFGVRFPGS